MERKKFLDKIANSEGIEKTNALMKYSRYLQQIDPEESARLAKQVLEIARTENDVQLEMNAMIHLATAFFNKSDIPETEHWVNLLIKTGVKNKLAKALGTAYAIKSRIALNQNNGTLSLKHMLLALDYFLESNDQYDLMSCYNGLGIIHLMKTELDEATHYFQLALQVAEEIGSEARHSIRVNIGIIQQDQKKYKEALESNFISLKYFQETDQKTSEASTLYNIGFCYYQLEDFEKSFNYLEKSYTLSKELNEQYLISKRSNAVATNLIKMGKLEEALPYIEESVELAEKYDLQWDMALGYETFSLYYKEKRDYQQAYEYLQKVLVLKEKISKENTQEKLAELEAKHKTQIYKSKSSELDKKNKAMSNQISILNKSLQDLNNTHQLLKKDFQEAVNKMNTQDDILSSQSRMAVMGEMVSSIAHQWRQPLNIIGILAQSIGDAWDFNEVTGVFLDKQIEHITEQISYMNETINDFRNFFKPDLIEEFELQDMVAKSLKLIDFTLQQADIKLETQFEGNCSISGNPNEIVQVLLNIINNARDAMLEENIPDPYIKITVKPEKDSCKISVFNKGSALPPEIKAKLFEPYFTTKGKDGTGIGLYISRMIIENKYHGKLEMENLTGGVEFTINIPVTV
ncbi:MAG: tetratricopeptide repeat-containing sensor histidine kinase [Candidatus Cloacimonetes bacterium]|nr:tetratricopeptide repeat-containing sensor histidine kinase [Candidatus Cloacimonadota bacterium]